MADEPPPVRFHDPDPTFAVRVTCVECGWTWEGWNWDQAEATAAHVREMADD